MNDDKQYNPEELEKEDAVYEQRRIRVLSLLSDAYTVTEEPCTLETVRKSK